MGHPVLRAPARPLEKADFGKPLFQKLIDDMLETMHEYNGVGLAAPQVHMGLRLFVALLEDDADAKATATVLANPEIVANADTREDGWEGCLSVPDIRGRVPRFTDVTIQALDRHGEGIALRLKKFSRARGTTRGRPSGRRAVLRPDDVDGVADIPGGVLALSCKGRRLMPVPRLVKGSRFHAKDDD